MVFTILEALAGAVIKWLTGWLSRRQLKRDASTIATDQAVIDNQQQKQHDTEVRNEVDDHTNKLTPTDGLTSVGGDPDNSPGGKLRDGGWTD